MPHRLGVAEIECDAADLRLVGAGRGRLDDRREAELVRRGDSGLDVVRDALGDERHAVRLEELACRRRSEPRVVRVGEGALDDLERHAARSTPATSGTEPSGRRSQAARPAARPSARAADSG